MAGFIPRAILAFLWNPLSGATPFRTKEPGPGDARWKAAESACWPAIQGVYPPARDTPTLGAPRGGPSADGGLHLLGKDGYETGERTDSDPNTVDAHAARAGIAAQIEPPPGTCRGCMAPKGHAWQRGDLGSLRTQSGHKEVGYEVWPAVRLTGGGQGTTAQG